MCYLNIKYEGCSKCDSRHVCALFLINALLIFLLHVCIVRSWYIFISRLNCIFRKRNIIN